MVWGFCDKLKQQEKIISRFKKKHLTSVIGLETFFNLWLLFRRGGLNGSWLGTKKIILKISCNWFIKEKKFFPWN